MYTSKFSVVPYTPELSSAFRDINMEWIIDMFKLESKDVRVLEDPQGEIIDKGGHILFVTEPKLGIIGTVALLKTGEDEFEITKMGVLKKARGLMAGECLLKAIIEKAESIGVKNLYLLTNKKCEAAIRLYEKTGFEHDKEIMKKFGSQYERCDVAMKYNRQ
jgi:N-acetylglutamate synthase-like GNAT family acetyltransferase